MLKPKNCQNCSNCRPNQFYVGKQAYLSPIQISTALHYTSFAFSELRKHLSMSALADAQISKTFNIFLWSLVTIEVFCDKISKYHMTCILPTRQNPSFSSSLFLNGSPFLCVFCPLIAYFSGSHLVGWSNKSKQRKSSRNWGRPFSSLLFRLVHPSHQRAWIRRVLLVTLLVLLTVNTCNFS